MSAAAGQPRLKRNGESGFTLIEVLVSFFILFVVTLAVLQLLSMAYLVNLGSLARSDMSYRAERVLETIRIESYLEKNASKGATSCCPVVPGSDYTIPDTGGCFDTFWGPAGANVVEPNARYVLSYTVAGNQVTVHVVPQASGPNLYLGPVAAKEVIYVAQI